MSAVVKHAGARAALGAMVCAALLAAACGDGGPTTEPPDPAPLDNPVDPDTAGAITGTVHFDGVPPPPQPISMRSDPFCAQANPEATLQTIGAAADGGLRNVFVYVKDGLGTLRFPIPAEPAVLDQRSCIYEPRVFGMQVGQVLEIRSSDATLHNINAQARVNREFNKAQSRPGAMDTHVFSAPEVMLPFRCDVHRWMNAWVGVLDHPFHAVTGADGTFRLDGLPPGTYTLEAWHETLGTQTAIVTIGARETGEITFTFSPA